MTQEKRLQLKGSPKPIAHCRKLITYSLLLILVSCGKKQDNSGFAPKPKGYNRIDLPVAEYQTLTEEHPFVFEYSRYAVIKPDTVKWAEPHWIYVYYPVYQAMIQLTYKPLNGDKQKLAKLITDAHKLAAKHSVKAYSIEEFLVKTPSGKYVDMMELEGEVPSQLQFYTTDSTTHYLRGALYFKTALHNDSLAPVINYMKRDINHMLNTLKWKN